LDVAFGRDRRFAADDRRCFVDLAGLDVALGRDRRQVDMAAWTEFPQMTQQRHSGKSERGRNRGRLRRLSGWPCTEDTHWTFVGDQVLEGKEAVRQYVATAYLEPPKFHVDRLISEGDSLTALGKISLKDETGRLRHYSHCDVWRLLDGKLFELQAFVVEDRS